MKKSAAEDADILQARNEMPRLSKKPPIEYIIFYNDFAKDYRDDYIKYVGVGTFAASTAVGNVITRADTEAEAQAITARLNAEWRAKYDEYDHAKSK